ncbi:MAG: hypothetical protein [Enterobacter phage ENC16]|nr:MAG: hypothetical protein [Enterobacter phage ENC16]
MNFATFIYLAGMVGDVKSTLEIVLLLGGFALVLSPMMILMLADMLTNSYEAEQSARKSSFKVVRYAAVVWTVLLLMYPFVPSTKTIYTMAAASGVEAVAKNPDVQKLAGSSLKVLEKKMQEYLNEKE